MDWVWPLYQEYVFSSLAEDGPSDASQEEEFIRLLAASSVTVLVQEPWQGSVRFKRLAVLQGEPMLEFMRGPEAWLSGRFGGGKFKINFHHGMHFVATRNFKLGGPARWAGLPDIEPQYAE